MLQQFHFQQESKTKVLKGTRWYRNTSLSSRMALRRTRLSRLTVKNKQNDGAELFGRSIKIQLVSRVGTYIHAYDIGIVSLLLNGFRMSCNQCMYYIDDAATDGLSPKDGTQVISKALKA